MWIVDRVRNMMRSFLQIEAAHSASITIQERFDYNTNAAKNRIWYRGDAYELAQLYKQIDGVKDSFWAAVPTKGMDIRKIHVGVPALTVDVLSSIVVADMYDVKLPESFTEKWNQITKQNDIKDITKKAVSEVLIVGDGAFRLSYDPEISPEPIIEFIAGDDVEYEMKRGRITEVIFKTQYSDGIKSYVLQEHYGYGYVRYELTHNDRPVSLDSIPETKGLEDATFDESVMLAVPLMFYHSSVFKGRGQSIFDSKTDSYDALDEAWSQWIHALRGARPQKFLPPNFVPKDPFTGLDLMPNPFDNTFVQSTGGMSETGPTQRPELVQPEIPHESYLATYITALDLALQGVISPSTLGIDTKKLDNAEAQREKEKTTLYTRNRIVTDLQKVLPKLITAVLQLKEWEETRQIPNINTEDIEIPFGEYANPSFESQVETVGKGHSAGIMSYEASVDELYGDTKTEEWKAEEVSRLKAQSGVETVPEPVFTE